MVPITIVLVFLLTWLALRSAVETAIVLLSLPFSVLGAIPVSLVEIGKLLRRAWR